MTLTINTFEDLLDIINTHPEWRRKLVRALFPDVNLEKALEKLAEAQERMMVTIERISANQESMQQDIEVLKSDVTVLKGDVVILRDDVAVLKDDVAVLKDDVAVLKTDMTAVKGDVAELKGKTHEQFYFFKSASVFGRYVRRGREMTNEVGDILQEAENSGQITGREFDQVMAADWLWGGRLRQTDQEVILVIEASWLAQESDVQRAYERAAVLRKLGRLALPVVAGREWTDTAVQQAQQRGVVITTNGRVDNASWQNALAKA